MYSIYPMILQDISQIDGHTVSISQPIQAQQLRTIAPSHIQNGASVSMPNTMTISASNLQALGVNINLQPTTHYATVTGYKFEW